MNILITGGAGFIGSNFITYILGKCFHYTIFNLDNLTYAGNLDNLRTLENHPRYNFIHGDICNRGLVENIFREFALKGVIHFAAESHVDNSIEEPELFIKTNVFGTFVLLDVARNYWMEEPGVYRIGYERCRFHHISTDEVYGTLGEDGFFTEKTPLAPNSPSKASSDLFVRSYYHTYGLNVTNTDCSNNYGPMQHEEILIPTIIRKALVLEQIPIYGDGKHIRDWLYILDHCRGIDLAYHNGRPGETYNIGGGNEKENICIANRICEILDQLAPDAKNDAGLKSYKDLITFVKDRPGHDKRYAIDTTKIEQELGWKAEEDFDSGILKTVKWYLKKWH